MAEHGVGGVASSTAAAPPPDTSEEGVGRTCVGPAAAAAGSVDKVLLRMLLLLLHPSRLSVQNSRVAALQLYSGPLLASSRLKVPGIKGTHAGSSSAAAAWKRVSRWVVSASSSPPFPNFIFFECGGSIYCDPGSTINCSWTSNNGGCSCCSERGPPCQDEQGTPPPQPSRHRLPCISMSLCTDPPNPKELRPCCGEGGTNCVSVWARARAGLDR
jgi:hypothetical protein